MLVDGFPCLALSNSQTRLERRLDLFSHHLDSFLLAVSLVLTSFQNVIPLAQKSI